MQEFTISTGNVQDVQNEQVPYETSTPQVGETDTSVFKQQKQEGIKIRGCFSIIFVLMFLVSTGAASMLGYIYFRSNRDDEQEDAEVMGVQMEQSRIGYQEENIPQDLIGKIFYTDATNVYMGNKDGVNPVQLSDYPDNEAKISNLQLIDGETLGFSRCEESIVSFNCSIHTIDIVRKDINTIKKLDSALDLIQLAWVDSSEYAYVVWVPKENKLVGRYIRGSLESQLFERETVMTSREDFLEDDSQLAFSPGKDKVYQIFTKGKKGFDFTVYVYDFQGNLLDEVEDATQPYWRDDNSFVYRKYSNTLAGYLYVRDIAKKKSSKVTQTAVASYQPRVYKEKVVFWEASGLGRMYLKDFQSGGVILLNENAAYPLWLSEDEIIFAKTRECKENECNTPGTIEFEVQFVGDTLYVYNLDTGESTKVNFSRDLFKSGVVTWYNKHS